MKRILFTLLIATAFIAACSSSTEGTTTDSGLQVITVVEGTGESPVAGQRVRVHYTGTLEDGTVFDSSLQREPIEFTLGQGEVIPGWDEGIAMMKEGETATLIIPPTLGYGSAGAGNVIPPDATLTFEVELVEIVPPPPTPLPPTEVDEYETTEEGLQYAVLQEGTGIMPQFGSPVEIHFIGWLPDGSQFANSYLANQPSAFNLGLNEILPGWDNAVALMTVGSVYQVIIPPELGFGEAGAGPIPPNSDMIFEIELVSAGEPAEPPTAIDESEFTTTESGLQYAIMEQGDGAIPVEGQTVAVHYSGWLENGIQFDSSEGSAPIEFFVGRGVVIAGWDEMLQLMPVGTKVQVIIPSELAYGADGRQGIPPNSVLIFEMELVTIIEE